MSKKSGLSSREEARRISAKADKPPASTFTKLVVIGLAAVVIVIGVVVMSNTRGSTDIADSGIVPSGGNSSGGISLVAPDRLAEKIDDVVDTNSLGAAPTEVPAEGVTPEPSGVKPAAEGEPAQLVIYQDPNCSHCSTFEDNYGAQISDMLEAGLIELEHRNLGMLDAGSPTNYSSRASNALACVADVAPASYLPFAQALFAHQPEGEMKNAELAALAQQHGAQARDCIMDGAFRPFVKYSTKAAEADGITGTPSVFLDGQFWDGSANPDFIEWAMQVIG